MNLFHLQPYAAVLNLAVQLGTPFVVGAKLLPAPEQDRHRLMLVVKNIHKESWLDESQMIDLVRRIGQLAQVDLEYGGQAVVGRDPNWFVPFTDVEVYVVWKALGPDDQLLGDTQAAQGISMMDPNGIYLWGWLPGHVMERVGDNVKIKTAREVYSLGYIGDCILTVSYCSPLLRLVKDPLKVACYGGEAHA